MAASVEPSGGPLKLDTKSVRVASWILVNVTNAGDLHVGSLTALIF